MDVDVDLDGLTGAGTLLEANLAEPLPESEAGLATGAEGAVEAVEAETNGWRTLAPTEFEGPATAGN